MGRVLERASAAAARAAARLISRSASQIERRSNRGLIDVEVEYLAGALCLVPLGLVAVICVAAIYGPVTPLNWGTLAAFTVLSALFLTGLGWVTGINRAGAAPPPPSGSPPVSRRASVGVGCTGGLALGAVHLAGALFAPALLGRDDAAVAGGLAAAGMPLAGGAALLVGARWARRQRSRAGVRIVRRPDSPLAFMRAPCGDRPAPAGAAEERGSGA